MKEFGADEAGFNSKMGRLEQLLHNYRGFNDIKDDFAKMLYSSNSKFFHTKGKFLGDNKRLDRESKAQLDDAVLEMIRNRELAARRERVSLEVFDV